MNFVNILENIGYLGDIESLNLQESTIDILGRTLPRHLPKLCDHHIIYSVDVEKIWKDCKINKLGSETSKKFKEALSGKVKTEEDLKILLKILLRRKGDESIISKLYEIINRLVKDELYEEYVIPIIPSLWNKHKTKMSPGRFQIEKNQQLEECTRKNYTSSANKLKRVDIGTCFNLSCIIADFYIDDLRVRIEHDGSQHKEFPKKYTDRDSDSYFLKEYGIKTIRVSKFSSKSSSLVEKQRAVEEIIKELYLRLEELHNNPKVFEGLRNIEEDTALMTVYGALWKNAESIYYDDTLFTNTKMKIGQIESPENLVYEEREGSTVEDIQ